MFTETLTYATFSAADGDEEGRDYRDVYEYADDGHDEEKCPEVNLPSRLVGRCKISDFCSNITCQLEVAEKRSTVNFKINRCEDPITATITIKSPGYSVNWKHTFKDGEIINVVPAADRGDMNSLAQVSISLKVKLKKEGKKLHFKVRSIQVCPLCDFNLFRDARKLEIRKHSSLTNLHL